MGKTARVCSRSGCPEIIIGDTWCPQHKQTPWANSTRNTKNPTGWQHTRQWVLRRDHNICQYCGNPGNEVDHVQPLTQGGTHHTNNLVCACTRCNKDKNYAERVGKPWTPPNMR